MNKEKEFRKKLIKIKSWKELFSRPKHKRPVNPKDVTMEDIIGEYRLYPKKPCSLTSCGTPHNFGYLITCKGDIETNIGNVCGKREFPEFVQNLHLYRKERNCQRYLDNINSKRDEIRAIETRIKSLYFDDRQGKWCYEKMKWQDTRGFDTKTAQLLRRKAKNADPYIRRQIILDKSNKEIARETGSSSEYKEEQVAMLGGISAIKGYKSLKNIFTKTLGEKLTQFKTIDLTDAEYQQLLTWHKYANSIDKNIRKAESIIEDCHRFLADGNLATIRRYKHLLEF